MLEIKANKSLYLDGEMVNTQAIDMKKFLMGCLNCETKLDENLKIVDLVHVLYDLKEFINDYFVEEYESVRALISMGTFVDFAQCLKVYKAAEMEEEGFFYINSTSEIEFIKDGHQGGVIKVCDLTFKLIEEIEDPDEILQKKGKSKFTLMDILDIIFEDFIYCLRNEPILR